MVRALTFAVVTAAAALIAGTAVGALSGARASDLVASPNVGRVVAWGCRGGDGGQCRVSAAARHGVIAIAAGAAHSLALTRDGIVIAWGCGGDPSSDGGQCAVPAAAQRGVIAIAAGTYDSLALRRGSVVAWGCGGDDEGQCRVPAAAQQRRDRDRGRRAPQPRADQGRQRHRLGLRRR